MKLSCLIVDDQKWFIELLEGIIIKTEDLLYLGCETDETKALEMLLEKKIRPDVLFLDIMMDNINGIDFAKRIKHLGFAIVFVTSSREHAIEAFKYGLAYLVKSFDRKDFNEAMDKVRWYFCGGVEELKLEKEILSIKLGIRGKFLTLKLDDIMMIKGSSNYSKLVLRSGKVHTAYISLRKLERRLFALGFFRVHKTYMVNLKLIGAVSNKSVVVGKEIIPISNTYYIHFINEVIKKTLP